MVGSPAWDMVWCLQNSRVEPRSVHSRFEESAYSMVWCAGGGKRRFLLEALSGVDHVSNLERVMHRGYFLPAFWTIGSTTRR